MRIKICNIGIEHLPKNLNDLDSSLLIKTDENGHLVHTGIMTYDRLSVVKPLEIDQYSSKDLLSYNKNRIRMIFCMVQKVSSKTTTIPVFNKLLGFKTQLKLKKRKSFSHCIFALVGHEKYDRTVICSIIGNPDKERFQETINILKLATNSDIFPEFIILKKKEILDFAARYISEGHWVIEASTNLKEGSIVIRHPDNIFQDPDVKRINSLIHLQEKISRGDWRFLQIAVKEKYAISISRTSPDIYTLNLYYSSIDLLIESCIDILQRIFAIVGRKMSKKESLDKYL